MTAAAFFVAGPVLLAWCKLHLWEWLAGRD